MHLKVSEALNSHYSNLVLTVSCRRFCCIYYLYLCLSVFLFMLDAFYFVQNSLVANSWESAVLLAFRLGFLIMDAISDVSVLLYVFGRMWN